MNSVSILAKNNGCPFSPLRSDCFQKRPPYLISSIQAENDVFGHGLDWKRAFSACFHENERFQVQNWVSAFGHGSVSFRNSWIWLSYFLDLDPDPPPNRDPPINKQNTFGQFSTSTVLWLLKHCYLLRLIMPISRESTAIRKITLKKKTFC